MFARKVPSQSRGWACSFSSVVLSSSFPATWLTVTVTGLQLAALKVIVVERASAVLLVAAVMDTVVLPVPWYGSTEHQLPPSATVAVQAALAVTESDWLEVSSVVNESVPGDTDKVAEGDETTGGFVQEATIKTQNRRRKNFFMIRKKAPTRQIGAFVKYTLFYSMAPVPALKSNVTFWPAVQGTRSWSLPLPR